MAGQDAGVRVLNGIREYLKRSGDDKALLDVVKIKTNHESHAENEEIITLLLRLGAVVNCRDSEDNTPLMLALFYRRSNRVIYQLIEAGANVNAICGNRLVSPLMCAIENNYDTELINHLIMKGADVNYSRLYNYTYRKCVLDYAICSNRYEIVELLINMCANVDAHDFVNNQTLPDCRTSCEVYDYNSGNSDFIDGPCKNRQIIDLLVRKGFDLKVTSKYDNESIIHLVQCNYLISLCIKSGLSIDATNNEGQSALYNAIFENNYNKLKSLLVVFNAEPYSKGDYDLRTPLHANIEFPSSGNSISLLLYCGANLYLEDRNGNTPLDLFFGVNRENWSAVEQMRIKSNAKEIIKHFFLFCTENELNNYIINCKEIKKQRICYRYINKCKKELMRMKNTLIKEDLTFYDFCIFQKFHKSKPVNMPKDDCIYDFKEIRKLFPFYSNLIILRIEDNWMKMRPMVLRNHLENVFIMAHATNEGGREEHVELTFDCLFKISRYLDQRDVYKLIVASTVE